MKADTLKQALQTLVSYAKLLEENTPPNSSASVASNGGVFDRACPEVDVAAEIEAYFAQPYNCNDAPFGKQSQPTVTLLPRGTRYEDYQVQLARQALLAQEDANIFVALQVAEELDK